MMMITNDSDNFSKDIQSLSHKWFYLSSHEAVIWKWIIDLKL